ncbi:hypothetical protein Tco_0089239 [Tanacetum coccineum]
MEAGVSTEDEISKVLRPLTFAVTSGASLDHVEQPGMDSLSFDDLAFCSECRTRKRIEGEMDGILGIEKGEELAIEMKA